MKTSGILLAGTVGTLAFNAGAQLPIPGAHYPVGLEGIRGAAMPAPGLNVRDDNYVYISTYTTQPSYDLLTYAQMPSVMWTSKWKILGARYSADVIVPIVYKRISNSALTTITAPGALFPLIISQNAHHSGVGDIKLEPIVLSSEWKQLDFTAGYALWVPSGHYDPSSLVNDGNGTWTHMATLGLVWYPDQDKTWAFSILNHYEFNSQQVGTTTTVAVTPGGGFPAIFHTYQNIRSSVYSMEWGVSKALDQYFDLGIVGYYQKQYSDTTPLSVMFQNSETSAIGPEFDFHVPSWNLSAKFRYAYEFADFHHPEGSTIDLEIQKGF